MKITITEITGWEEDEWEIEGTASHIGEARVMNAVARERDRKERRWKKGLPFVFEVKTNDERKASRIALGAYSNKFCEFDYLKPAECDYEIEED